MNEENDSSLKNAINHFNVIQDSFKAACQAVGETIVKHYRVASHIIELRFAGSALVSILTEALAHLEVEQNKPELIINIFDGLSSNTKAPTFPWQKNDHVNRGTIVGYSNDRIYTHFQGGSDALSFLDLERNLATYCFSGETALAISEQAAPFRVIFDRWLRTKYKLVVHSAALGLSNSGALLVGKGGSGKSTTSASCIRPPLIYLGDDYVCLSLSPELRVYSLYNSIKLVKNQLEDLTLLAPHAEEFVRSKDNKQIVFLEKVFPKQICESLPIRATIVPQITKNKKSKIFPITKTQALFSLAPSSILQSPTAGQKELHFLKTVIAGTKTFCLELGSDLNSSADCIVEVLK